jgi:hypothetical protein
VLPLSGNHIIIPARRGVVLNAESGSSFVKNPELISYFRKKGHGPPAAMVKQTKKWRKTLDATDAVDSERNASHAAQRCSVSELPDDQLFFIDKETGRAARKRNAREQPLRSERALLSSTLVRLRAVLTDRCVTPTANRPNPAPVRRCQVKPAGKDRPPKKSKTGEFLKVNALANKLKAQKSERSFAIYHRTACDAASACCASAKECTVISGCLPPDLSLVCR